MDIDTEGTLHLDTGSLVGKSAALLGITGSGKTNTAAVLIEELLSSGLPLTIVVLANSEVFFVSGQATLSKSTA